MGRVPERLRTYDVLTSAKATGTYETSRGPADHKPSAAHGALFTATIVQLYHFYCRAQKNSKTVKEFVAGRHQIADQCGLAQSLTTIYGTDWRTASTAT